MSKEIRVTLTEDFIVDAHSAACSDWKLRLERKFPEVFRKGKYNIGDWIRHEDNNITLYVRSISRTNRDDCSGFGLQIHINGSKTVIDQKNGKSSSGWSFGEDNDDVWRKATPKEIKDALVEIVKEHNLYWWNISRGSSDGIEQDVENFGYNDPNEWYYDAEDDILWTGGAAGDGVVAYQTGIMSEKRDGFFINPDFNLRHVKVSVAEKAISTATVLMDSIGFDTSKAFDFNEHELERIGDRITKTRNFYV